MFNDLMMACAFYLLTGLLVFFWRLYWWVYYSPEDFDINKSNKEDILLPAFLWPIFFVCMIVDYASNILNKKREDRIKKQKGIDIRPYWWESEDKDGDT